MPDRCSGCYVGFSGPWCDNCDQWPCICMSSCTCDECWERFKARPGFTEYIENSLDVHSMDLTGISGPSQEAIESVAREEWAGIEHE